MNLRATKPTSLNCWVCALSPGDATTEPTCCHCWNTCTLEPVLYKRCHQWETCTPQWTVPPLTATREMPAKPRKTQCSRKKKNNNNKNHPKNCTVMSGPRNWYGCCQDSGSSLTTRIPLTLLCLPLPCFSPVVALPAPGPNPWKLLTSISLILLQESYITEVRHFEIGFFSCPV